MSAIVYDKVMKKIGNRTLIDQVSFTVEQGEIFGLLGSNGAGKTTLMKMTVGLLKISEGKSSEYYIFSIIRYTKVSNYVK